MAEEPILEIDWSDLADGAKIVSATDHKIICESEQEGTFEIKAVSGKLMRTTLKSPTF